MIDVKLRQVVLLYISLDRFAAHMFILLANRCLCFCMFFRVVILDPRAADLGLPSITACSCAGSSELWRYDRWGARKHNPPTRADIVFTVISMYVYGL